MSRNFQLQLVRKTLTELGHVEVADLLAQRLAAESSQISDMKLYTNPILELIQKGDHAAVVRLLSRARDGTSAGATYSDDACATLASLTANETRLAVYLVLRFAFLEQVLASALEGTSPRAERDAFDFLSRRVSKALDQIDLSDPTLPFATQLSKERESAVLLPLAMQIPQKSDVEAAIFNPQVLLTTSSSETPRALVANFARLRNTLAALLRLAVGVPKPGGSSTSGCDFIDIPDNCLADIIHKATRYNEAQSLYHLPPRTQHDESSEHYVPLEAASRDDLPIHLLHTLAHHTDEVWFTRFSPSGRFLATGSLDGTCLIYDVADNFRLLAELDPNAENEGAAFVKTSYLPPLDKKKGIIYFSWEPYERYLVTCCLDTVIRVWNVSNIAPKRRVTRSMNVAESAVLVSCFTLGERMRTWPCEFLKYDRGVTPHFIVGSPDKVLKVYSIYGEEVLDFYSDAEEWSSILGEDPAPNSAASTETPGSSGARRTEEASHASSEDSTSTGGGSGASQFNRINDIAITPNGRVLITANNDKQVFFYKIPNLFDPSTTTSRIASLSLNGRLTSCNISADGRYMLLSIAPEELQLWDISPLDTFEKPFLKQKFLGQSQAVYMVRSCFGYLTHPSMREELVLSGSDDGYVYIWKLETGQLVTRVKAHEGLCNSVDWNRFYEPKTGRDYGMYWCSVGDDQLVKIWGPKETHPRVTHHS